MPFRLIAGTFHLVGRNKAGTATGFEPDGDSIHFRPRQPKLLDTLDRVAQPYQLSGIGSTQLRFEGIDALEIHFAGSHQPRPIADEARDFLTGKLKLNPVPYKPPSNVKVLPPVVRDGPPGYILSRALETNGRPVAFAFAGDPPQADGSAIFVKPALLRTSLNFKSVAAGQSYPLFYDTLFPDLRKTLSTAATSARAKKRGIWRADLSTVGLPISNAAALEQDAVVFPKLFRRLSEYLKDHPGDVAGFAPWLAEKKEQILDLTTGGFTHFDNVLALDGAVVRLLRKPEDLVFVSAKTGSAKYEPWLRV